MKLNDADLLERLAGDYALGTLRGAARRRFERHMQQRPELRERVERLQQRLAPMASLLPAQSAPSHTWDRIEARLFGAASPAPRRGWAWRLAASLGDRRVARPDGRRRCAVARAGATGVPRNAGATHAAGAGELTWPCSPTPRGGPHLWRVRRGMRAHGPEGAARDATRARHAMAPVGAHCAGRAGRARPHRPRGSLAHRARRHRRTDAVQARHVVGHRRARGHRRRRRPPASRCCRGRASRCGESSFAAPIRSAGCAVYRAVPRYGTALSDGD